jgi:hypothetical protein
MVIEDIDIFLWGGEVIEYVGLLHKLNSYFSFLKMDVWKAIAHLQRNFLGGGVTGGWNKIFTTTKLVDCGGQKSVQMYKNHPLYKICNWNFSLRKNEFALTLKSTQKTWPLKWRYCKPKFHEKRNYV